MPAETRPASDAVRRLPLENWPDRYSRNLVYQVCCLSGSADLLADQIGRRSALRSAIASSNTPFLFDWLMVMFSYQGISDAAARGYIALHGNVFWADLDHRLNDQTCGCRKLDSFWRFAGCGYEKARRTCAKPALIANCPLPNHPLRNGRLNQTAYSLFLFLRDVAANDLTGFIRQQLAACGPTEAALAGQSLIAAFRGIYGVSDKILAMALSSLLMAAPKAYTDWHAVGANLIVVDTLVHNFLERTGISWRADALHAYGPRCYGPNGCANLIERLAAGIDASRFNSAYPVTFPRFVQNALFRYCAKDGLNICNGNRIEDCRRCVNVRCGFVGGCDRIKLRQPVERTAKPKAKI